MTKGTSAAHSLAKFLTNLWERIIDRVVKIEGGKFDGDDSAAIRDHIKTLKDGYYRFVLVPYNNDTDERQRGYWFSTVVASFVRELGEDSAETMHAKLVHELLPELRTEYRNFNNSVSTERVSWTDLTKDQRSTLIDRAIRFAVDFGGFEVPPPR